MRVLAFSDWRVQDRGAVVDIAENLSPPADVILYAGDDLNRFVEDGRNYFEELAQQTTMNRLLFVYGNDDASVLVDERLSEPDSVLNLQEGPVEIGNYGFLGIEGAPEGTPGYILHSEDEIKEHLESQKAGVETKDLILVSHMPPHGILDIGQRFGQEHIGSKSVREFVENENILLDICGHCHQFGGRAEDVSGTTVINIASHDDEGAEGNYAVIDVDGQSISHRLETTEINQSNDMSQLTYVGGKRLEHMRQRGFTDLDDFTEERKDTLAQLPGSGEAFAELWIKEAQAIRNDEIVVVDEERFQFLNESPLILFDIETDLAQSTVWLIGAYSVRDDEFIQFFDPDDEESVLKEFLEYLSQFEDPKLVSYSGTDFDQTCIEQSLEAHSLPGFPEEVMFYDLGKKVQFGLAGSFREYKLSKLAVTFADYDFAYAELTGFEVGAKFSSYQLDGEEPDWEKLKEYNKDDVMAMKAIISELRNRMS